MQCLQRHFTDVIGDGRLAFVPDTFRVRLKFPAACICDVCTDSRHPGSTIHVLARPLEVAGKVGCSNSLTGRENDTALATSSTTPELPKATQCVPKDS